MPSILDRIAAARAGWTGGASLITTSPPPHRARLANRRISHAAPRRLKTGPARTARLEIAPVSPLDLKPDPWQRLLAIGSILSVIILAVGLFITNSANRHQQEATRRQQDLAASGQITDRFAKAVEQLGQPGRDKMDVRLGAIYSLERIMRDSAVDHPAVVEVLAAFVRVHALASDAGPIQPVTAAGTFVRPKIPEDIQAALTVLVRRDIRHDQVPEGLNLAATNLGGARLSRANLNGTYLDNADLRGASLGSAKLRNAFMGRANLYAAELFYADLTDAFLGSADLRFVRLQGAELQGADLQGADLRGANLQSTSLVAADLSGADLRGTAGLTPTLLRCATMDDRTRLPAEVPRPAPLNDLEREACRFS